LGKICTYTRLAYGLIGGTASEAEERYSEILHYVELLVGYRFVIKNKTKNHLPDT